LQHELQHDRQQQRDDDFGGGGECVDDGKAGEGDQGEGLRRGETRLLGGGGLGGLVGQRKPKNDSSAPTTTIRPTM
jgi:hypothetical protein